MNWISVKDDLPKIWEDALCYSDKNGGYFFIGYYDENLETWCKEGLMHCYNVTHWAYLEAP